MAGTQISFAQLARNWKVLTASAGIVLSAAGFGYKLLIVQNHAGVETFSTNANGDLNGSGTLTNASGSRTALYSNPSLGKVGMGTRTPDTALDVVGVISGVTVLANNSFSGAGLSSCTSAGNALQWNSTTGRFSCTTITGGTPYTGGRGIGINGSNVVTLNSTITGSLVSFQTLSGTNLKVYGMMSGSALTVSGNASMTGNLLVKGTISSRNTLSGAALKIMNGASYVLGNMGVGSANSPHTKLEVFGSMSGSSLTISGGGTFSGAVLVKGNVGTKGTFSGAALKIMNGASYLLGSTGIGSANATHTTFEVFGAMSGSALTVSRGITASGNMLLKGNVATRGIFSGAALTIMAGGTNYILPNLTIGTTTNNGSVKLGIAGAVSGATLYAASRLASSGGIVVAGTPLLQQMLPLPLCDASTACATGSGAAFRVTYLLDQFFLSGAFIDAAYSGTSGNMKVQIRNMTQTCDMLSTVLNLNGSKASGTGGSTIVNGSCKTVSNGDILVPFVQSVNTTPAKGVTVTPIFWPKNGKRIQP